MAPCVRDLTGRQAPCNERGKEPYPRHACWQAENAEMAAAGFSRHFGATTVKEWRSLRNHVLRALERSP